MTLKEYFQQGINSGLFAEKALKDIPETACLNSETKVVDGDAFKDQNYVGLKSCDCLKSVDNNALVFVEMKRLNHTLKEIQRGCRRQFTEEELTSDPAAMDRLYTKVLGRMQQLMRAHALPFKYTDSKAQLVAQMGKDGVEGKLIQDFVTRKMNETFVLLHDGTPQATLRSYIFGLQEQLAKVFVSKYNHGIKPLIPVKLMSESEFDAEYGDSNGE